MLCCLLIGGGTAEVSAQGDYDPVNPPEPSTVDYCKIRVKADPEEGAYVSGGGIYKVASTGSVYISTSARNTDDYTYTFRYWSLDGVKYTESRNFYVKVAKGTMNFVAHYDKQAVVFDPKNPAEPSASNIKRKYMLTLSSSIEGGCSFNISSGDRHAEGESVYLRVYPSADYKFDGWMVNGKIVSHSAWFYYTMPSANTTIEAVLTEVPYDPANPGDPQGNGNNVDNGTNIPGDANSDGNVTMADASMATSCFIGKNSEGIDMRNADINGDGKVTMADASMIMSIFLGKMEYE